MVSEVTRAQGLHNGPQDLRTTIGEITLKNITAMISVAMALLLGFVNAHAQLEVSVEFGAAEAETQEFVTVHVMVANRGADRVLPDVELVVSYGDFQIGPLGGKLPLPGESEFQLDHDIYLVPMPRAGDLSISLSLIDGDAEASASATVLVTPRTPGQRPSGLGEMAQSLFDELLATAPVTAGELSIGSLKAAYTD